MFERIKAYKNLKKGIKFVNGAKQLARFTGDEKSVIEANEALYEFEKLKGMLWRKKVAKNFNLECIRRGL